MPFRDRREAGRRLAAHLVMLRDREPVVVALPRGGVPVADEVAKILGASLELWVVRKVMAPGVVNLAIGAVAEGGSTYVDPSVVGALGVAKEDVSAAVDARLRELDGRIGALRGSRGLPVLRGRTVIVVDDCLVTGSTARAALQAIRAQEPKHLMLAVPVASTRAADVLCSVVDSLACVHTTPRVGACNEWYESFPEVDDALVMSILAGRAAPPLASATQ